MKMKYYDDCKTTTIHKIPYKRGENKIILRRKAGNQEFSLSGECPCGFQSFKIDFSSNIDIPSIADYFCDTPFCETHSIFTNVEIDNIKISTHGDKESFDYHSYKCGENINMEQNVIAFVNPTFYHEVVEGLLIKLSLTNVDHKLAAFWRKAYLGIVTPWGFEKAKTNNYEEAIKADKRYDEAMIRIEEMEREKTIFLESLGKVVNKLTDSCGANEQIEKNGDNNGE